MTDLTPDPIWTTERIREAFLDDGGQAEYHDPINGAADHRRAAGAIFDAWLAAHDAAPTAPPTDDEREALALAYIEFAYPDYLAWTGGVGPLEALRSDPRFILNAKALAVADVILAAGFCRQGPITDEQVAAAARAYYSDLYRHPRDRMRAALEAARAAR